MRTLTFALAALLGLSFCSAPAQAAIIQDFDAGIGPVVNHPAPGVFGTWYDITSDAFGTPSAGTLDGSPALSIGDGGFTNGVYVIYENAIPATGTYSLSAAMGVLEDPAGATNGPRAYQMGVVVNGSHRPNPGDLAAVNPADAGSAVGDFVGLTPEDDSALATQLVTTGTFTAMAGDDLLVAFATDVTSGNFDLNSGTWGTAQILVDNLQLNLVPEPSTFVLAGLGLVGVAVASRRRKA